MRRATKRPGPSRPTAPASTERSGAQAVKRPRSIEPTDFGPATQRVAVQPARPATPNAAAADPQAGRDDPLATVGAGLQALGLSLTDAQLAQLSAYLDLLRRWNRVYNLTAVRDRDEMVSHHLLDCLAVLPRVHAWAGHGPSGDALSPVGTAAGATVPSVATAPTPVTPVTPEGEPRPVTTPAAAAEAAASGTSTPSMGRVGGRPVCRILDVGSGGGLPGVVLAICRPDWSVTCVDTVAKKASFIRQVAAELRLQNLQAQHARVEHLGAGVGAGFDLVTARAFSSLPDMVALTRHLLADGGVWMAMKGLVPDDEIRQLPADIDVFHVEQLAVPGLDAQRCLVWMRPRITR